jgi:hypothetical protein
VRLGHVSSMRLPEPLCGNIFHRSRGYLIADGCDKRLAGVKRHGVELV